MITGVPFFLTVDTEGDNLWNRPSIIKSTNVEQLSRFQNLCNKYNIKPIYLTNYEAAINKTYIEFVKHNEANLEIGLHLHAWNSPELYDLTGNDYFFQPYLHEYPEHIIENKIDYLVKLLQDTFQTSIESHRGGRYSINNFILKTLKKNGLKVDCSVVPGYDWTQSTGDPQNKRRLNFTDYSRNKYEIIDDIIEFPVSTYCPKTILNRMREGNFMRRGFEKIFNLQKKVLRSNLDNLKDLIKVVEWNLSNKATHIEYMIHSSELVQGTSHLIKNNKEKELFYENLERFFIYLKSKEIQSKTFKEYLFETGKDER